MDEAGQGPLLGPMVVAAVGIDGPANTLEKTMLPEVAGLPVVADSKVILKRKKGLMLLEHTVLAVLTVQFGRTPRTLVEAIQHLPEMLELHPWYGQLTTTVPQLASLQDIEESAELLQTRLTKLGSKITTSIVRVYLERDLNGRWKSENKDKTQQMILREVLAGLPPIRQGQIVCDRLSGRKNYTQWVPPENLLQSAELVQLDNSKLRLQYNCGGHLDVSFHTRGETQYRIIALASCFAKYVRELLMHEFNAYFLRRYPEIRPTKGYRKDGERYLDRLGELSGIDWRPTLARIR